MRLLSFLGLAGMTIPAVLAERPALAVVEKVAGAVGFYAAGGKRIAEELGVNIFHTSPTAIRARSAAFACIHSVSG